jgi:5-methylcytosine-specific restriction endonuclease McrA
MHRRVTGRRWQKIVALVVFRDGGRCWICGGWGANSADHIVPIAEGGHPTSLANLRAAHRKCNYRRNAERTNAIRREREGWREGWTNPYR